MVFHLFSSRPVVVITTSCTIVTTMKLCLFPECVFCVQEDHHASEGTLDPRIEEVRENSSLAKVFLHVLERRTPVDDDEGCSEADRENLLESY